MQEQLLGYLLGALDPDEHSEVEEKLSDDPLLRYQLEELRTELAPLEAARGSYEPPLALAARTCEMVAARPMVAPSAPPATPSPVNAPEKILPIAWGRVFTFMRITIIANRQ